ncbi:Sec-independent protein translocase protein TatB [Helicobacter ailurogastricus]|uniref:Sec-independent protein translocase protein TatB homolog n=1 Tax=Helicobacter ailurogastricus TaxID=1578720 RepID=A0A0K2X9F0_9HELI|nr:Sec-independent protein translocase protein TatB [Helicobacter ailurogastricus]CRF40558.1 Twin-arginine translocation protein TatB [Helicobacter ailurogastricus]CRF42706.1 Twin-arginine translocation protein TatB [Helicobacter ailurogastricus]CRF43802.1 Twin-arginine translocation protein TatB [Helicobacter ailurogastricus]
MFGMGFFELVVIVVVAIIFLGPEKFPQAMLDLARFFRAVKKSLNEAKESLDKEIHMEELKKEALEYQEFFKQQAKPLGDLKQELENIPQMPEVQDLQKSVESIAKSNPLESLNAPKEEKTEEVEKPKVSLEKTPKSSLDA